MLPQGSQQEFRQRKPRVTTRSYKQSNPPEFSEEQKRTAAIQVLNHVFMETAEGHPTKAQPEFICRKLEKTGSEGGVKGIEH